MKEEGVTLKDVLQAVSAGFSNVEGRFDGVEGRLKTIEDRLSVIEERFNTLQLGSIDPILQDIKTIKADFSEMMEGAFEKMDKEDLLARIKYVERRLNIVSGK